MDLKLMKKKNIDLKIKKCKVKFTTHQANHGLQMLGRTKAVLKAVGGTTVSIIVYVVKRKGHC